MKDDLEMISAIASAIFGEILLGDLEEAKNLCNEICDLCDKHINGDE